MCQTSVDRYNINQPMAYGIFTKSNVRLRPKPSAYNLMKGKKVEISIAFFQKNRCKNKPVNKPEIELPKGSARNTILPEI